MVQKVLSFSFWRAALTHTLIAASFAGSSGCDKAMWSEPTLAVKSWPAGTEIRVLALTHPLVYNTKKNSPLPGYDYELIKDFAARYGFKIKWIKKDKRSQITEALKKGEGDLAVGRFYAHLADQASGLLTGPTMEDSRGALFCDRNDKIRSVKKMEKLKIYYPAEFGSHPGFGELAPRLAEKNSLKSVKTAGEALKRIGPGACAIVDELEGQYQATLKPNMVKITALNESLPIVWLVNPAKQPLLEHIAWWFMGANRDARITRIQDRYHVRLTVLSDADLKRFHKSIDHTLNKYISDFKSSAKVYGIDWRLVAAVSYQESHWNEDATSFTGVKGLMQLTKATAEHLGIDDRLDPSQSIWGGSYYLKTLMEKFDDLNDPHEKVALALAAYNSGMGHLKDAQLLARRAGTTGLNWLELRSVYPMLADENVAKTLKAGTARGHETVQFVDRVMAFYTVLSQI